MVILLLRNPFTYLCPTPGFDGVISSLWYRSYGSHYGSTLVSLLEPFLINALQSGPG